MTSQLVLLLWDSERMAEDDVTDPSLSFFQINRENGVYSLYSRHGKGVDYRREYRVEKSG